VFNVYLIFMYFWCVGLGAKPRRWAPLTRDTRKGIKRVKLKICFFLMLLVTFQQLISWRFF